VNEERKFMEAITGSYQAKSRNWMSTFTCSIDCQLGAYQLSQGEPLRVVSDGDGLYSIYVAWGEGAIARIRADEVNKLAGITLIEEEVCTGFDPIRCDDPH